MSEQPEPSQQEPTVELPAEAMILFHGAGLAVCAAMLLFADVGGWLAWFFAIAGLLQAPFLISDIRAWLR